ncbi:MAG TPA: hypothetical protein VKG05_06535 [Steroidobacteraceae bacterium]|nr:hypothetical protein [Steroidobacteraceae bacterium]
MDTNTFGLCTPLATTKFTSAFAILTLACLFALPSASDAADVAGSRDHPLMTSYPGSSITEYSQQEYAEYTLPLGIPKDDQFPKNQHLEGKLTHIHYDMPQQ